MSVPLEKAFLSPKPKLFGGLMQEQSFLLKKTGERRSHAARGKPLANDGAGYLRKAIPVGKSML